MRCITLFSTISFVPSPHPPKKRVGFYVVFHREYRDVKPLALEMDI